MISSPRNVKVSKSLFLILFFLVSKTLDELVLEWKKDQPVTTAEFGMSQFELDNIEADKCPSTESFGQIGNVSVICGHLAL